MRIIISILVLFVGSFSIAAEELISVGEGFDKKGEKKVFDYQRFREVKDNKTLDRAIYKDLDGNVMTEEKMEMVDGKLVRYDMDQLQLKQKAWVEVTEGEITFNLKKWRKRNYPQTIKWKDNFIVGLQIVPFIIKHWDHLSKGKEKEIKLGVWHRQEAITFDLSREKSGGKEMVIKMSPASMLIRAIVDPIYFHFDKKTKALTSYLGRTTPKEKRGKGYYDFDGLVRYKGVAKKSAAPAKKMKSKKGK